MQKTLHKPYSESCDQNRDPILSVLQPLLKTSSAVLEIGSGTGQHAVYFAEKMPHLKWHTSDCEQYLPAIRSWITDAEPCNVVEPNILDVSSLNWPEFEIDCVFSANTAHIMNWPDVLALFSGVGKLLHEDGKFLLYGPFNYNGQYSSASNASFDGWLKSRDHESGIRNFEDLCKLAKQAGMELVNDYEMPANNRILYWQKLAE